MKRNFLIVGALIFGFLAAFFTWSIIDQEQRALASRITEVPVLRVTRDIMAGEKLKREDIEQAREARDSRARPQGDIPVSKALELIGKEVAFRMQRGDVLHYNDIAIDARLGSGFSRIVDRDYRAVTISVDATSSVNNLIRPGDHVDIIGTFQRPDMKGDQMLDNVTLTFMQNVTVLATGADYGQNFSGANTKTSSRTYSTITLQVTPSEAEMLVFAAQKGTLTCTLRPPTDANTLRQFNNVNWELFLENVPKFSRERAQ